MPYRCADGPGANPAAATPASALGTVRKPASVDILKLRDDLKDAVEDLSPALREAVLLRVALDLPYEEVASRLSCTVGAARVRVSRGLDALFASIGGAP